MTTPLARLGTFLFPSHGRRISAPAPGSPHEPGKRRSAIAACDSPPRCRRRLSFADVDVVIEYPPSPVDVTPLLRERANELAFCRNEERRNKWKEIAEIARPPARHAGLDEQTLRDAFVRVFEKGGTPEELSGAVAAFDAVLAATPVPLGMNDVGIVKGVLAVIVAHARHAPLLEGAAALVLRNDWGRVFADAVREASLPLAEALLSTIAAADTELHSWEASLQLLAMCAEAGQRARRDEEGVSGRVSISRAEAEAVLGSFERLADRDADCTESALRALRVLLGDKEVAAAFVVADGSAVVSEVSSVHAQKLSVQHACIDVLVALSAPRVL